MRGFLFIKKMMLSNFRFVIALDEKHGRQWILTAFDIKKKKR